MSDYEKKELKKLMTVLDAAQQNGSVHTEIRIQTTGHDPSASTTIPAYILAPIIARAIGK